MKNKRGPKVYYGEKGWRFVRLWQTLLLIVEAEKPLDVTEINRRLAMTPELRDYVGKLATTRDDLWTLVRCGFPIRMLDEKGEEVDLVEYLDQDSRRGRHKNTTWALKPSFDIGKIEGARQRRPTSMDLTSLSLLRALLQENVPPDFALYEQIRALLDELHRWLIGNRVPADRTDMISRFVQSGKRYVKRGPGREILIHVAEALQQRSVVEGLYRIEDGKDAIVRALPLAAWWTNGRGHMLAARAQDGGLRSYRLDKFETMKLCPDAKSPNVDDQAVEKLLAGSFGGFVAEPEEVKLIVDPAVAYLFDDYQFHSSQRVTKRKNGSLLVRLNCAVSYALEEWILGFGEHVEVTEPDDLRKRIAQRHQAAVTKYSRNR